MCCETVIALFHGRFPLSPLPFLLPSSKMAAQARHLTLPPRPVHARGPDGTVGGLRARRTLRMWRLARRGPPLTVAAVVAASASGSPGGWYGWLAQTAPVHWAEGGLVALQAAAELPWWAAIVCGGAALRTAVTLPLAAHQSRLLAKVGPGGGVDTQELLSAGKTINGGTMVCAVLLFYHKNAGLGSWLLLPPLPGVSFADWTRAERERCNPRKVFSVVVNLPLLVYLAFLERLKPKYN